MSISEPQVQTALKEVVDPNTGKDLPPGQEGEICIKGPQVMAGYWNRPEATAEVLKDGWLHTGDLARMDADGYFWFVGRSDDVIKSSGYRIGPFEVESALLEHPAVQEAAVVGSPDRIRGMIVKAFVVLNKGYEPSESLIREIKNYVKRTTAPYKYPREIEFIAELPKTISGKIKRNELRAAELKKYTGI